MRHLMKKITACTYRNISTLGLSIAIVIIPEYYLGNLYLLWEIKLNGAH